jgi:hypothetical protein
LVLLLRLVHRIGFSHGASLHGQKLDGCGNTLHASSCCQNGCIALKMPVFVISRLSSKRVNASFALMRATTSNFLEYQKISIIRRITKHRPSNCHRTVTSARNKKAC